MTENVEDADIFPAIHFQSSVNLEMEKTYITQVVTDALHVWCMRVTA
jgi:hypothetical protein